MLFNMLMTLIRVNLQGSDLKPFSCTDFNNQRGVRTFSVQTFVLCITRMHIRETVIRSNVGWFLLSIL